MGPYYYQSKGPMPTLPKAKTQKSELGVRKGLLTETFPAEKMGEPITSILRKYRVPPPFMSRKKKMGRVMLRKSSPSRIPLMIRLLKAGAISLKATGAKRA